MTTFCENRTVLQPPYLLRVFNSYSSSSQASALPPYLLTSVACVKLYMMAFESGTATPRTLYDLSSIHPISLRIASCAGLFVTLSTARFANSPLGLGNFTAFLSFMRKSQFQRHSKGCLRTQYIVLCFPYPIHFVVSTFYRMYGMSRFCFPCMA